MIAAGPWWQYAVVALIVVASALQVVRKIAPRTAARGQAAVAAALNAPARPRALRRLGTWLQPAAATGHCGDGCGTCSTCGPADDNATEVQAVPVTFHPRKSSCH